MSISGHGATLGFGTTTTFSPGYTSIGGWAAARESLDTSTLATTGARTKIGGDLFDIAPFSCEFLLDMELIEAGEADCPDDLLFDSGAAAAAETITVTYPNTNTGTCAASGHVTEWSIGDLVTDTLMTGTIAVQWNDWPVFSDGEA